MKNKLNKALTLSSVEFSESFSCVRASCLPPAICVWKNIMGLGGGGGNAACGRRAGAWWWTGASATEALDAPGGYENVRNDRNWYYNMKSGERLDRDFSICVKLTKLNTTKNNYKIKC